MVHKKFLAGILALALIFGMTLIGCEMATGGGGNNGGNNTDSALNGTWRASEVLPEPIMVEGTPRILEYDRKMENGNWEQHMVTPPMPMMKGSYTTSGDQYIQTITHYHGFYLNLMVNEINKEREKKISILYNDDEYYPFSVMKDLMKEIFFADGLTGDTFGVAMIEKMQTVPLTYSIRGKELTLTMKGETFKKLLGYDSKDLEHIEIKDQPIVFTRQQ